jgi:hypothetical protein
VTRPEPASANAEQNDYVFERVVRTADLDGNASYGRIDLYKLGCFVLEAKQSRQTGGSKEIASVLGALQRMGFVTTVDAGRSFSLRLAA